MASRLDRAAVEPVEPVATVVVLNYRGRRFLETCLTALLRQQFDRPFEVLLVDNDSGDGSVEYVRERFPQVVVLPLRQNQGFAGGNNRGVESARGRYVVLLNNDTRARSDWLAALVATAEADPQIGAVTSKLVFLGRQDTIQNVGSLLRSDGSGADRGFGELDRGQYEQREEVFAACGGAALFNRRALDDVGLLDETFFIYYEDTDLSWRMRLRGWRVIYEPAAVVEHVHTGTNVEWSPLFTFHVHRNRLFMIVKNAPPGFALRALAGLGWRALAAGRRGPARGRGTTTDGRGHGQLGARMYSRILASFVAHLPEMLAKRWVIRRGRRIQDACILRWVVPREPRSSP